MSEATPGPSIGRGTFEEGGRTKEEGDVICGVWSENTTNLGGAGVRWRGGARNAIAPTTWRKPKKKHARALMP